MSAKLTTAQVADRLGVSQQTVKLWCRQDKFPNAELELTARGPIWQIPESDLKDFTPPKRGRIPDKLKAEAQPAQNRGTIASQTRTTRKLDQGVKRAGDRAMGGKKTVGVK